MSIFVGYLNKFLNVFRKKVVESNRFPMGFSLDYYKELMLMFAKCGILPIYEKTDNGVKKVDTESHINLAKINLDNVIVHRKDFAKPFLTDYGLWLENNFIDKRMDNIIKSLKDETSDKFLSIKEAAEIAYECELLNKRKLEIYSILPKGYVPEIQWFYPKDNI